MGEDAGAVLPDEWWPAQLTGTDAEFLLREESVIQLCDGLYTLTALAERHVAEYDELPAAEVAEQSLSALSLPPEARQIASQRLDRVIDDFGRDWDSRIAALDSDDLEDMPDPFEWAAARFGARPDSLLEDIRAAVADLPSCSSTVAYLARYGAAAGRGPRLPVMQRALLITAIASAEAILKGVIHRILFNQQGGSWHAPTLDRAVARVIDGGTEKWEERFPRELGINPSHISADWSAVKEIWARRNVLVHHGGIADSRYCQRVGGAVPGTHLAVDGTYLHLAIDLICGFLAGFLYTAWSAFPDRCSFAANRAAGLATIAEAEHRWPLAENLYMASASLHSDPEEGARAQVNAWLARIRWRGPESVLADATDWAPAGLPAVFTVARMILTGQADLALGAISQLIKHDEVTRDDLATWPLFDSIRDRYDFQRLLAG